MSIFTAPVVCPKWDMRAEGSLLLVAIKQGCTHSFLRVLYVKGVFMWPVAPVKPQEHPSF